MGVEDFLYSDPEGYIELTETVCLRARKVISRLKARGLKPDSARSNFLRAD